MSHDDGFTRVERPVCPRPTGTTTTPVSNYYAHLPEVTSADTPAASTERTRNFHRLVTDKTAQAHLTLVVTQMTAHYEKHPTNPRPAVSLEDLLTIDTAESVKTALMTYTPNGRRFNEPLLSKSAALWNRVALQRLRFQGQRRNYLVVYTLDQQHRLLVLEVPPAHFTRTELLLHAQRQATYHDDITGRYRPGLRLRDTFVDHACEGEEFFQHGYIHGFPLQLVQTPAPLRMDNYDSYSGEHRHKSEDDAERQHTAGYIEELLYYPTVIHPQGGILKENGKYRPVLDCAASGLNENLVPLQCNYDLLEDTLAGIKPGDHLSGFDWKDAFLLWPRTQHHCDYLGVTTPSGRVFRYRFTPMGLMDSPAIQSWGARILKRAINSSLKTVCERQAVPGALDSEVLGVFVDDGKLRHDKACDLTQMNEQFQAYVDTIENLKLPGAGEIDSIAKRDWPAPTGIHTGVHIDPQTMNVSVTDERRAKYLRVINDTADTLEGHESVPRHLWASLLGKLQFTAPLVKGMQARLSTPYGVLKRPVSGRYDDWRKHSRSHCRPDQLRALRHAAALLNDGEGCRRRMYYDPTDDVTTFWKGLVPDSHAEMDASSSTLSGIHVYTGDADKGAAGLWYKDKRHVHPFPAEHQPPHRSSNFRELSTALIGLEQWGELFRKQRVLYRSDNTTTVAIINKGGTTAPDLLPVAEEIISAARHYDVDLAAAHIPGVQNGLADRLSRHRRHMDNDDWKLGSHIFEPVHGYLRQHWLPCAPTGAMGSFTLDGNADVTGSNAQLPRFCSEVDSIFDRDLRGEHLWCNPAFTIIADVLRHFLEAYRSDPQHTSGTFLLPEWTDYSFWPLTKNSRVVARYPRGTHAFTSPDWRALHRPDGAHSYDAKRVARGATRWPFVIIHFPCAGVPVRRRPASSTSDRPRSRHAARGQEHHNLPVLYGDPARDDLLLRGLPPGLVQ